MNYFIIMFLPVWLFASQITVQVLGSGGPEHGERASASYLIKKDEKGIILVDFGAGALLRYGQAKSKIEDLQAVIFTHLHIDHVVELPALLKAGYFSSRCSSLNLIGPSGNDFFPGFNEFIQLNFGENGAYRYMSDMLTQNSDSFSLKTFEVDQAKHFDFSDFRITAAEVNHGIVPALAYKIEIDGKVIVFSGDTSAKSEALTNLSKGADILIAHHAIAQEGNKGARQLHMRPSRIAEIAKKAKVKRLLLSHRMKRTIGRENTHQKLMQKVYKGEILWAEDLMQIKLP